MLKQALPLISIITPVYNVERYLRQCIDSVIAQTFQSWELLLIDDGSTDGGGAVCDEYVAMDARIRVVHKENTGLSDSRNVGISLARGQWIGFIDSDDWVEKDMYELMHHTAVSTDAEVVICGYFTDYTDRSIPSCSGGNTVVYTRDEGLWLILEDTLVKSFACDKLFRRSVITDLFPKSYYYEDYATIFKWFAHSHVIARIESAKYHYRQRMGSIRNDKDPEKVYHFFQAEMQRYQYICAHSLLPAKQITLAGKVVKTGLTQAKGIVRQAGNYDVAMQYLRKIKADLGTYVSAGRSSLKLSCYLKSARLMHFPACFYVEVYLKDLLKSLKKRSDINLYS